MSLNPTVNLVEGQAEALAPDAVAGFADTAGDYHVNLDIARQVEEFLHAVAVEAFHWAGVVPRLGHREHKRLRHQAAALVHNHAIIVLRNLTHHRNE